METTPTLKERALAAHTAKLNAIACAELKELEELRKLRGLRNKCARYFVGQICEHVLSTIVAEDEMTFDNGDLDAFPNKVYFSSDEMDFRVDLKWINNDPDCGQILYLNPLTTGKARAVWQCFVSLEELGEIIANTERET